MSVISEIHQVRPEDEIKEEHLESEIEERSEKDIEQDTNQSESKKRLTRLFSMFRSNNKSKTGSERSESD